MFSHRFRVIWSLKRPFRGFQVLSSGRKAKGKKDKAKSQTIHDVDHANDKELPDSLPLKMPCVLLSSWRLRCAAPHALAIHILEGHNTFFHYL